MSKTLSQNQSSIVPVNEVALPEVNTKEELEAALKRVFEDGLPAFVIRSTGLADVGNSHYSITGAVANALPRAKAKIDTEPLTYTSYRGRNSNLSFAMYRGAADFHHDMLAPRDTSKVRVHRTKFGSGKATFGNSGPLIAGHKIPSMGIDTVGLTDARMGAIDANLIDGLVDKDLIHPTLYSTELGKDDTVVFPVALPPVETHDKAGPVFHQFDTSTPEREAIATVLEPTRK